MVGKWGLFDSILAEHFLRVLFSFFDVHSPVRFLPETLPLPGASKLLHFPEEPQLAGDGVRRGDLSL